MNAATGLADIEYFDVRHTTKTEIIVMLDYHPERSGIQMHFCRVIGINEARNDVEVVDSYTGRRIWLSSLGAPANKLIYSAVKFEGPGSGAGESPAPSPAPMPSSVPGDAVGKRVYLDANNENVPVYHPGTNNIRGYLDPKNYESARSYSIKGIDSMPNRVLIQSGLFGSVAVTVDGATSIR